MLKTALVSWLKSLGHCMPTAAMHGIPAEKKKRNHKTQNQICMLLISALNTQLHFQYSLKMSLSERIQVKVKIFIFQMVIMTFCYLSPKVHILCWQMEKQEGETLLIEEKGAGETASY